MKPWLMRILVNAVLTQQRKRRLATVPLEESAPLAAPAGAYDSIEASEDRQAVRHVLAQLSPEHREVVVLRYFADLTGSRGGPFRRRAGRHRQVPVAPCAPPHA